MDLAPPTPTARHPQLTYDKASVRPLVPAILLLACLLALLTALLWGVVANPSVFAVDRLVNDFLAAHRQPTLTLMFLWFTYLGKSLVIAGCALLTIGVLEWQGRRQYLLALAVTLAGAEASVQLVKHAVGRARPDPLLAYYIEPTFSFPSTHTTLATAFYGFLAYAIMQEAKDPAQRRLGLSAAFLMVLIIAVSRLYLGVHYLSDVGAGFLLGLSWVLVGIISVKLCMRFTE